MSCLLNTKSRESLRKKIANDFLKEIQSEQPFSIDDYIIKTHAWVKEKTNNEGLAFDTARLIPLLASSVLVDPAIKSAMRAKGLTVDYVDSLSEKFDDTTFVKTFLGLGAIPIDFLNAIQDSVNQLSAQPDEIPVLVEEELPKFNDSVFRTDTVLAEPGSKDEIAQEVQHIINLELRKQVADRGISNSSEMDYPGVTGGIYMTVKSGQNDWGGLITVITDKAGVPIKFNRQGDVNPNGMVMWYNIVADPIFDKSGNIVTDKAELEKLIVKKNANDKKGSRTRFNRITKQIEDGIKQRAGDVELSTDEYAALKNQVIEDLNEQYSVLRQARKYLNKNPKAEMTTVISGKSNTFVYTNSFKPTPLKDVDLQGNFVPNIEKTVQDAGSVYKQGTLYFSYPRVSEPIMAIGNPIMHSSNMMNTIIDFFTKDIYIRLAGINNPISANERTNFIDQIMFTSDMRFQAKLLSGGGKKWVDSKGNYEVKVGEKFFKIRYDDSAESKEMRQTLEIAISDLLTKPTPKDITHELDAIEKGQPQIITDLKNATPNAVYLETAEDGTKKYFRLQYPTFHAKASLLNTQYDSPVLTDKNGQLLLTTETKDYNEFIVDNFSVIARVTDGQIKDENIHTSVVPTAEDLFKFYKKKAKAVEKTEAGPIDAKYAGKVVFMTPGSGKSDYARKYSNIIDADILTIQAIAYLYPDFKYRHDLDVADNIFNAYVEYDVKAAVIYPEVEKMIKPLLAEGKTVLTGSSHLIYLADYVYSQIGAKVKTGYPVSKELTKAKELNKDVIKVDGFAQDVLGKPTINKIDDTLDSGQLSLFGLDTTNPAKLEFHINTLNVVSDFLEKVGVERRLVPNFLNQDGSIVEGAVAAANFIRGTVDIIEDAEKRPSAWNKLPEEAAHFWYRLLKTNTPLKKALWASAKTEQKAITLKTSKYGTTYNEFEVLREEAIGQLIAEAIKRIETDNASAADYSFFKKFIEWVNEVINNFLGTSIDPFEVAAMKILSSDMSDLMTWDEYRTLNNIVNFADVLTEQSVAPVDYTLLEDIGLMTYPGMPSIFGDNYNKFTFKFTDGEGLATGKSSPSFDTQTELDMWVYGNIKEYTALQKAKVQEVRDNKKFFDRLLNKTARRRSTFLKKTLKKYYSIIDDSSNQSFPEWRISDSKIKLAAKLTEAEKKNLIVTNNYTNIAPTLKVLPTILKKYKKNPIALSQKIKVDGAKKQELAILNNIKDMISIENPDKKTITAEEFVNEVHNWLETHYLLGFANETGVNGEIGSGYPGYNVPSTFVHYDKNKNISKKDLEEYRNLTEDQIRNLTPEKRQMYLDIAGLGNRQYDIYHNKVSIRFNDFSHYAENVAQPHFKIKADGGYYIIPSAFGSLTYFYTGDNDWKDAVLLHEIQNDNIEYLKEFRGGKVDIDESLTRYLQGLNEQLLSSIQQIQSGGKKINKDKHGAKFEVVKGLPGILRETLESLLHSPEGQGYRELKARINEQISLFESNDHYDLEKRNDAIEEAYIDQRRIKDFIRRGGIKSLLTAAELKSLEDLIQRLNTQEVEGPPVFLVDENQYEPGWPELRTLPEKKQAFKEATIELSEKLRVKLQEIYGEFPYFELKISAKRLSKAAREAGAIQELNPSIKFLAADNEKRMIEKANLFISDTKTSWVRARNAGVKYNFHKQLVKITPEQYDTLIENYEYNQNLMEELLDKEANKALLEKSNASGTQNLIHKDFYDVVENPPDDVVEVNFDSEENFIGTHEAGYTAVYDNDTHYYINLADGTYAKVKKEGLQDALSKSNTKDNRISQREFEFEKVKQKALAKKAELDEKYGTLEQEVKDILDVEMNYFTPLIHHLIQKHIKEYGRDFPMYFSGYNITNLTQSSARTALIYAGKDEVAYTEQEAKEIKKQVAISLGLANKSTPVEDAIKELNAFKRIPKSDPQSRNYYKSNMSMVVEHTMALTNNKPLETGAIYNAMTQVSGIKLVWQESIKGINGEPGGYLVDLSNYHYNTPVLYGLDQSASGTTAVARDAAAEKKVLTFEESTLLVNSIDSAISSKLNDMVQATNDTGHTTQYMKKAENRKIMYAAVLQDFKDRKAEYEQEIANMPEGFAKTDKIENLTLINWAIENFGDIENLAKNNDGKGLIYHHILKSRFLSDEERDILLDDIDEVGQLLKASDLHAQAGNEKSIKDLAPPDVQQLIKSIHKFKENGDPELNVLGFQELVSDYDMWNKIARTLSGEMNRPSMYKKLMETAVVKGVITDYSINELTKKLGHPKTTTLAETNQWLDFWKTFNLAEIPLVQMSIKAQEDNRVTIGSAHRQVYKVGNLWKHGFNVANTEFIKPDPSRYDNRFLDLTAVIDKFASTRSSGNNTFALKEGAQFDFLNAIGIRMSNKPQIKEALSQGVGAVPYIFQKMQRLVNERGITNVYSIDELFKEYEEIPGKKEGLKGDQKRFNDLKELETQYADYVANDMVTNANGDVQFERSLHNSISIMVSAINEAKDYATLISHPYMRSLDIKKNSFARTSIWLNSIFDLSKYSEGTNLRGPKRQISSELNADSVKLTMNNLSGVQLIDENGDQGSAAASSDPFTKLILDFHLTTMAGRSELMRHADKSTSFSVWLNRIVGGAKSGKFYVDTMTLIDTDAPVVAGYTHVVKLMKGYLNAELERMHKLKEMSKTKDLVYDAAYLKAGQQFSIFEDILTADTRKQLMGSATLNEVLAYDDVLTDTIEAEIIKYFEDQTKEVEAIAAKTGEGFIDSNLILKTRLEANSGVAKTAISDVKVKKALFRSFVINNWIHNIESMIVIYGDIALYNMKKEEFHKRNAGAGSTGNLFAHDEHIIDYVNDKGRLYGRGLGYEKKLAKDGSFNTVVLADSEIPSASYDKILANVKLDLIKKNQFLKKKLTPEEIDNKAEGMVKNYGLDKDGKGKMTEGDGQGWITFDFYRVLSILEGKWSSEQEAMYNTIIEGGDVDMGSAVEFFPTRKFQYWGSVETKEDYPPLTAFHKFSLFPMIPTVIKGTNLEKLHNKMVMKGMDYGLFKSGSKVNTVSRIDSKGNAIEDKFYSDDRTHTFDEEGSFTSNTIYLQFLKDQLEIAPYYKGKNTFPTQMRKLIENGLMEAGVPIDFKPELELKAREKAWKALPSESAKKAISPFYGKIKAYEQTIAKLTELRKQELIKQADIKFVNGVVELTPRLRAFLISEMSNQDLAEHEIDFINQQGALDFSTSLSAEKIEKVLQSIVVRKLVKQKFNGEGLIQVSGAGFEQTLRGELTESEKNKYATNELPFYQRNADGSTAAMKIKVALQGKFMNLLYLKHPDGNSIGTLDRLNALLKDDVWLDTGNHRKMITMIGPRIPVQGLNSMEFAEVYEFLPTEAGNIVVLPSEIVAKSGGDFDIDKLTFMMPNISSGIDYEYWTTDKGIAKIKELAENTTLDLSKENIERVLEARKLKGRKSLEDQAVLKILRDNSTKNVTYVNNDTTTDGLENMILDQMRDFLSLKENYIALIRPNDTDIVMPLAEELASDVMDKDYRTVDVGDGKKRIAGTRVFEIGYNLYKHASNNIGKQTLGLGAVDNTYNALFNRIGARMNYEYSPVEGVIKRLTIHLPHNTLEDEKGREVISLSHILNAEEEDISDIINQLINGWVDIAKDAWIFNLQGNKEISPTLLFMIQAGVPLKQAVYLVSNPMIREYVKEQQLAKSTFAGPLGKSPGNPLYFRNQARRIILGNQKYGININADILKGKKVFLQPRLDAATENAINTSGLFNPATVEQSLRNSITDYAKQRDAYKYTENDRAAFLHFIELEEMAKSMTAIKTKTNVDTSRTNTLFEAQNRLEMIEELKTDGKFPEWMILKLIGDPENNDPGESPIASFNIQGFQIKLWRDFFKLRNNDLVNGFLMNLIRDRNFIQEVEETWGTAEKFTNSFRNDLVPFVFQNSLREFNIENIKSYKNVNTGKEYPVKATPSLNQGVFVKDVNGQLTVYIDKIKLKKDYVMLRGGVSTNSVLTLPDGKTVALAPVPAAAFPTADTYYSFVVERELLRAQYPGKTHFKVLEERSDVKAKLEQYKRERADLSDAQINTMVYEETIRDMALDNTFNTWKLFKSRDSMADQLVRLKEDYPELARNYSVVRSLGTPVVGAETGTNRIANIVLNDIMLPADRINILHQNLKELSNPNRIKIDTMSLEEKKRVAHFFEQLSIYAFLQAGLNTTGMFSLVRIVPQEKYKTLMKDYEAKFLKKLNNNILSVYWKQFKRINSVSNSRLRRRYRDYTISNYNKSFNDVPKTDDQGNVLPENKRIFTDNQGNVIYYANDSTEKQGLNQDGDTVVGLVISTAKAMVQEDPTIMFVMNGTTESTDGANKNEAILAKIAVDNANILLFPTRRTFAKDAVFTDVPAELKGTTPDPTVQLDLFMNPVFGAKDAKEITTEGLRNSDPTPQINGMTISAENKLLIDKAIQSMKEYQNNNYKLAFPGTGVGQYMIGADPLTGALKGDKINGPAQATFVYLSQELFKNFGYVNRNYDKALYGTNLPNIVQESSEVTDAEVIDALGFCFI